MELIARNVFQQIAVERGLACSPDGDLVYDSALSASTIVWALDAWEMKRQPYFIGMLLETLDPWQTCWLAGQSAHRTLQFSHDDDCPVMGYCPLMHADPSVDAFDDRCRLFDAFCLDHWERYETVRRLPVPAPYNGALSCTLSELNLVESLLLAAVYFGDEDAGVLLVPDHGRQVLVIEPANAVTVLARDQSWGEMTERRLAAAGFTSATCEQELR